MSWREFFTGPGRQSDFLSPRVRLTSYLLYGSGAGEVEVVVPLRLTMADDEQEVLV